MQNGNAKVRNIYNKIIIIAALFAVVDVRLAYGLNSSKMYDLTGTCGNVFAVSKDPVVVKYNPALLIYFEDPSLSFSSFNLSNISSCNSCSAVVNVTDKMFFGLSVSDLLGRKMEAEKNARNIEKTVSTNVLNCVLSLSGFSDFLKIAYGLNIKYLYYGLDFRKYIAYLIGAGIAKDIHVKDIFDIKLGASVQNSLSRRCVYRLSSALIFPAYYRFYSKDSISLYFDIRYKNKVADICCGTAYTIADKYSIKCGYYPRHFSIGTGIKISFLYLDYTVDFSKIGLINNFTIVYKFKRKRADKFIVNGIHCTADKNKEDIKLAEEKFKRAKSLYYKREYFRASDLLADILALYPDLESPKHFYRKIRDMMEKTASQNDTFDFGEITYARSYINYYNAKYVEALSDWKKYINFRGEEIEEIEEYLDKIKSEIKVAELEKRELELGSQAEKLYEEGVKNYSEKKWVDSIKKMENLKKFLAENNFSKTVEYCDKANEYINKAVAELSKNIKDVKKVKNAGNKKSDSSSRKIDYDKAAADEKYKEGLILYAQGKYYEAERSWELALRLNPGHKKAKIALLKLSK